jgi:hypothetical protein
VKETIRKMTCRTALNQWEMKTGNCEVTPQAIGSIVKSLIKRDGPKALAAIHGPLGLKYQPLEKPSTTADGLKNQFTVHDL